MPQQEDPRRTQSHRHTQPQPHTQMQPRTHTHAQAHTRTNTHAQEQKRGSRAASSQRVRAVVVGVCAIVLVISAVKLISYISDYSRSRQISNELRAMYMEGDDKIPMVTLPPATAAPVTVTEAPLIAAAMTETPVPTPEAEVNLTPDPLGTLPPLRYPANPYKTISERFQKLRRQNKDIIGWLSVEGLLSEAVVQRDNDYYLRRDYRGYHNVNGAVFLEEGCSLDSRPYTLTLYAHNMKTGAMFGCLRNYENITFYHNNPFVTFDTVYEEGRYVIFSVAKVSTDPKSSYYSRFFSLDNCTNLERKDIIDGLCRLSEHTCNIDVDIDDQLLLLVTCVDNDADRRLIAARRVRDGESEADLQQLVRNTRNR